MKLAALLDDNSLDQYTRIGVLQQWRRKTGVLQKPPQMLETRRNTRSQIDAAIRTVAAKTNTNNDLPADHTLAACLFVGFLERQDLFAGFP